MKRIAFLQVILYHHLVLIYHYADLHGQFSDIGFLIAVKSILRVTDKPKFNANDATPFSSRKHTEFVLIGTFLSFGIASFVQISINYLLDK